MITARLGSVVGSIAIMAGVSGVLSAVEPQTAPIMAASEAARSGATLNKYCVSCHNEKLKTAGLMLDKMDVTKIGDEPEAWEKVVRKLRGGSMPPAGRPRPDKASYDAVSTWLETELDRAAAAHPNPGGTAVHRLNRTEYQNVIRDLLTLDVDVSSLLPGDDAAFGFDNIAELLKVSPDLLDGYLAAANKISRLAVGDKALSLGSATYNIPKFYLQNDRAGEDLPFGSRGGAALHHYFPYDGEYIVKIRVMGVTNPPAGIEVRVDGNRAAVLPTTGRGDTDPSDKGAVEARIPVKAGQRVVGVSLTKQMLEPESRYPQFYPWGNSAVFATNTGANPYLKIETVDISGPFHPLGPGETSSRRRIFVCRPTTVAAEEPCANRILTALAHRAFRRPVTIRDVRPLLRIYKTARRGSSFTEGIQAAIERVLVDPNFLFRIERNPATVKPGVPYRIGSVELASRLSFFLWSSMPDEELLQLAERGRLSEPAVLEQQVRRMLADARSTMLATNFATQWLYLRNVKALVPDTFQFPDWDEDLRTALTQETELFLTSQLREDRSVMELMTSNYTFVNERLAKHYGIPDVYGSRFRRVTLPDGRRSGLLGQASILAVTSQPNRTSPVQRGKWVLENLLGTPPPPPPPNVPDLPANEKEQPKSIRERMEQHRKNPVCAGCHATMDPLGFALENFDAIGTWRATADGRPIDNTASLPDGTKLDGPDGLRQLVESRRALFLATVTEKLLTYALGRGVEYYDMPTVRTIVRDAAAGDFRWSSIVLGITTSTPFQMSLRRTEP
jgi:mono/diheme cytochrome c family protein